MDQLQEEFPDLNLNLSKATGYIHHADFFLHNPGIKSHPERPQRTQCIDKTIKTYVNNSEVEAELFDSFGQCSEEEILLVHPKSYFEFVESQFEPVEGMKMKSEIFIADTYTNQKTASIARLCVKGVLVGVDMVMQGKWKNGFCSVRPPGHHAGHKARPNGFCIYNNVAIAARYARMKYDVKKILIFDWDVHHCDGTESVFYEDPDTLLISIHRFDEGVFYPKSGDPEKIGDGQARYFNVNVGWNTKQNEVPGFDEYVYAYDRLLGPIAKEFNPELILISAGYDSAKGDHIGGIENTKEGYQYITGKLMKICSKVLAILEGGYCIEVTAECALATFKTLLGKHTTFKEDIQPNQVGINAVTTCSDKHKEFWKCLTSPELLEYEMRYLGKAANFISGGHLQSFKVVGDKLIKHTKKGELTFYSNLMNDKDQQFYDENQKMRKWIPKIYEIDLKNKSITMENICDGLDNASILDIKLGYKTYDPLGSDLKRAKEIQKALQCDQVFMGFRVAGVKIRDKDGKLVINKNGSTAYSTIVNLEHIKQIIIQVLKSNEQNLNKLALKETIEMVDQISDFIKTSKRFYRNSSILLVVDNLCGKHAVRWIDFNYVNELAKDIESPDSQYDSNIYGGLCFLSQLLRTIQNEN